MRGILRTFGCLNARCGHEFDAWEAAPECPKCRSVKVCWRPRGGHIHGETTKHNDRTLKSLANSFGLTDMGQRGGTHEGEPVKRDLPSRPMMPGSVPTGIPGIGAPWGLTSTAGWSSTPHKMTRQFEPGAKFTGKRPAVPTEIVARDSRKIPI